MKESKKNYYAIADRPGYFGGNKAMVYSAHRTLRAATKKLGESKATCIVCRQGSAFFKGQTLWGDMFPEVIA